MSARHRATRPHRRARPDRTLGCGPTEAQTRGVTTLAVPIARRLTVRAAPSGDLEWQTMRRLRRSSPTSIKLRRIRRRSGTPTFTREVWLGKCVGINQFGVNHIALKPGFEPTGNHWHEQEDEFIYVIYVLSGEVTLIDNNGEHLLREGDFVGFPAGVANPHCLANRSAAPATCLAIGNAPSGTRNNSLPTRGCYPNCRPRPKRGEGSGFCDCPRRRVTSARHRPWRSKRTTAIHTPNSGGGRPLPGRTLSRKRAGPGLRGSRLVVKRPRTAT